MSEVSQLNSREFIKHIRDAIQSGFGINPLLGSGISSASGIIMGNEFSQYLGYAAYLALSEAKWDFRSNGWPSYPAPEDYAKAREWTYRTFKTVCDSNGYSIEGDEAQFLIDKILPVMADGNTLDFSIQKAINCPPVPANIKSSRFAVFDASANRILSSLRDDAQREDPYEPLWPKQEQSRSSTAWINELGVRSLADWRITLRFISRIEQSVNPKRTLLSAPNSTVIDRFNTFITADKQPNLTHKMLAALARPLRMRVLLTTNFDTLLEDSFMRQGHLLKKFFVSSKGSLPDPFLVRAQPSIIKLHGELLETRADLTLDQDPSVADLESFTKYFFDVKEKSVLYTTTAHLLVIGFSASDMRIVRMLQYLLDNTKAYPESIRPIVYWLCHSKRDIERVNSLFPVQEYGGRVFRHLTVRPDLLLLELYQRASLALPVSENTYEFSHSVPPTRSDPNFGADEADFDQKLDKTFSDVYLEDAPSVRAALHKTSPLSLDEIYQSRDELARIAGHYLFETWATKKKPMLTGQTVDRMFKVLTWAEFEDQGKFNKVFPKPPNGPFVGLRKVIEENKGKLCDYSILFFNTIYGALESLGIVHAKISSSPDSRCLWFELADYANVDSLLRKILRSIAIRTGRFQREHVLLHPLKSPLASATDEDIPEVWKELKEFFDKLGALENLSPSRWTILLYGREPAGSFAGWDDMTWDDGVWPSFFVLILALAAAKFRVIVAHPSSQRFEREKNKITELLSKCGRPPQSEFRHDLTKLESNAYHVSQKECLKVRATPDYFFNCDSSVPILSAFHKMCESVLDECAKLQGFRRFLYATCWYRQSRRPNALFTDAVQPCNNQFNLEGDDNDWDRSIKAIGWTEFLEKQRIFYKKAGGFAWMHREMRLAIRAALECAPTSEYEAAYHDAARIHSQIGDWYDSAFFSTGYVQPALESLHHHFQAAMLSQYALPKDLSNNRSSDGIEGIILWHRMMLFRSSVNALSKTLAIGRQHLKLWLANRHGIAMFEDSTLENAVKKLEELEQCFRTSAGSDSRFPKDITEIVKEFNRSVKDTQRAIRRESDLGIAGYAFTNAPHSTAKFDSLEIREKMDGVLESTYLDGDKWTTALIGLFATVNAFSIECGSLVKQCFKKRNTKKSAYARKKSRAMMEATAKATSDPSRAGWLEEFLLGLECLAYGQLRRAKFTVHTMSETEAHKALFQRGVRLEWMKVTRLCNLGLDWCKQLRASSLALDGELRVRFHSYYAVALANLDRFFEAHRHINNASAINARREAPTANIELAKLNIRRAEVILTEVHRLIAVLDSIKQINLRKFKKSGLSLRKYVHKMTQWRTIEGSEQSGVSGNEIKVWIHPSGLTCLPEVGADGDTVNVAKEQLSRLLIATLDDAWFAIENAEHMLSGRSQSSLWWGRIALMKLRACGYQYDASSEKNARQLSMLMLAYRHRRINPQYIWEIFEHAYMNTANSLYRKLRLMRYAAKCICVFALFESNKSFLIAKVKALRDWFDKCEVGDATMSTDAYQTLRAAVDKSLAAAEGELKIKKPQ